MSETITISISDKPVCVEDALKFISCQSHGAENVFIGRVRNFNEGRKVLAIYYEIFKPLVLALLQQFSDEAQQNYGADLRIYIYHRFGELLPGEIGMLVAVSSPHRVEAYAANRAIVEAIKHQCPIWKKEFYSADDFKWLQGCSINN
ncbi:molybdopterin synthase catalytic subunit MoaE [soil metagenome]